MKLIFSLCFAIVLYINWVSANEINSTFIATRYTTGKARFVELIGKKLKYLWNNFVVEEDNDSFIGRCFGVARKLKFAMPLIIFKLGVIGTILAFLTIFSLKTLALLGFLVLLNVSGAMTKLAVAFSGKHAESKDWSPPQNVHLHVHQTKDGHFNLGHTSAGWDDRIGKYENYGEEVDDVDASSLYNKLYLNNLLLKNHNYVNR